MFKTLAEFVMRGRIQSVIVALLGSWVPFVSQAVLGLVTLRKGWREGLIVSLWASLPAFVGLWVGQVAAPLAVASILVFVVGFLVCCVLRMSISWSRTLMATVVLSTLSALFIVMVYPNVGADISIFFSELFTSAESEIPQELDGLTVHWDNISAGGLIAYWIAFSTIIGVLVARWWQALVYKPGGFQEEFHQLRLAPYIALLHGILAIAASMAGAKFQFWAGVFSLPLLFAGLGLLHWVVAKKAWGLGAVAGVYLALILFPVSALVLMLLALLDAMLDIRKKLNTSQGD